MIRYSEYFEQTDKYLNSELTLPELKEFEIQMEIDSGLAEEVNLHRDVEQAMCEQDIISLRNSLNQIVQSQTESASNENISVFDSFSFGLTEELSSKKNSNAPFSLEDIFNFGHSFPKIHLYQHKVAGKENIHQFYKDQFEPNSASGDEPAFSPFDEELFADIQYALEENDISDIRANLAQISRSMPAHQFSAQDIEDFIDGQMDQELKVLIEAELTINPELANEVRLIKEIGIAGAESDIMDLRASLIEIQKSEFQSTASIKNLEGYLQSELSDEELASFEAELTSNRKLVDEIELIKNIDLALQETDVMLLRNKLQGIAKEISSNKRTERSFAGKFKAKRIALSAVAASLILLLGITGIMSRQSSEDEIYQKFYNKYEATGIVRSAKTNTNQTLTEALQKFDNKEYKAAMDLFSEVINRDQNNMVGHFYTGVSLQETGKYTNAIKEYEIVMVDKDNLFTEQAEWYIGLCYLQANENKKAYRQFKKIAKNEGFYQQKAQSILTKIKYSE